MNSEIEKRIEQIDQGIVPEGYKKTRVGIIPEDWEVKKMGEISKINQNNIKTEDKNSYYYYDLSSIDNGSISKPKQLINYDELPSRAKRIFKKDDILFSTVRPNLKGFGYIDFEPINSICSTGFAVIESKENVDSEYVFNHFFTNKIENRINSLTVGSNYPALNVVEVKNLQIPIPEFNEQEKIADILSLWDEAIETTEKLIKEKEIQKKGLMQELLTGKTRLPGFDGEWEEVKLSDISERVKEKNNGKSNNVLTISAIDGLINQEKYFSKQIASKNLDNYTYLQKGDFAYNKSYSKGYLMGAIRSLDLYEEGVVSSLYICFRAKENVYRDYLNQYFYANMFNHEVFKIAQEGARNHGLLNIGIKDFFGIKLFLPPLSEQITIANILSDADKEIQLLKQLLENRKQEKKGLMQVLLTGIVRV